MTSVEVMLFQLPNLCWIIFITLPPKWVYCCSLLPTSIPRTFLVKHLMNNPKVVQPKLLCPALCQNVVLLIFRPDHILKTWRMPFHVCIWDLSQFRKYVIIDKLRVVPWSFWSTVSICCKISFLQWPIEGIPGWHDHKPFQSQFWLENLSFFPFFCLQPIHLQPVCHSWFLFLR